MKKYLLMSVACLMAANMLNAQEMDRVPKQLSFEAGYRYVVSSEFDNNAPQGYTFVFDYAWQLSGFHKKKASFISVPIAYTIMPAGSISDQAVKIISYGWTVRHNLARDKNVIPWMGYALLLNQYKQTDVEGKVFGHQTRFTFGADFKSFGRFTPYLSIDYSMTNFPVWGEKESKQFNHMGLKLGLRL